MMHGQNEDMRKSTILIGGGVIATHYVKGLENSETLRLDALVDTNPDCAARRLFSVPFFTDVNEALRLEPQVAILALPVALHGPVACELLSRGVDVITEKPMFATLREMDESLAFARECGRELVCMFHWTAASEVRFLKENLHRFGRIKSLFTEVRDDYAATADGSIRADRRGLMGAWLDSGINILSYFDEIVDLGEAVLAGEDIETDVRSGLPKYVRKEFRAGDVSAVIVVDWRENNESKISRIECEAGEIFVNHMEQEVRLNGEVIFSCPVADRLSSHYENLFRDFSPGRAAAGKNTVLLHNLLFKGCAK